MIIPSLFSVNHYRFLCLKHVNPHLSIIHFVDFTHGFLVIHALNGLVDDAMTDSKYRLVGERSLKIGEEILRPTLQFLKAFNILRPFHILQIGYKLAREITPVALSEQGRCLHILVMWRCNNPASVDRTFQIARHKHINLLILQLVTRGFSLLNTLFIKFSLQLSLQNLGCIINGFAVAY